MCSGYPLSEDLNGYQQEGVGLMDSTVHQGMRWSTASAYLRPALKRQVWCATSSSAAPSSGVGVAGAAIAALLCAAGGTTRHGLPES